MHVHMVCPSVLYSVCGDPTAWNWSGGWGSIPLCPGESYGARNGGGTALLSCPLQKESPIEGMPLSDK